MKVDLDSIPKTAFITKNNLYEFLCLPFGLKNRTATFHRQKEHYTKRAIRENLLCLYWYRYLFQRFIHSSSTCTASLHVSSAGWTHRQPKKVPTLSMLCVIFGLCDHRKRKSDGSRKDWWKQTRLMPYRLIQPPQPEVASAFHWFGWVVSSLHTPVLWASHASACTKEKRRVKGMDSVVSDDLWRS